MTTYSRIAVVFGLLLVGAALAFTFSPAKVGAADCGTWLEPEWSDNAIASIRAQTRDMGEAGDPFVAVAEMNGAKCEEVLSMRRTSAMLSLLLAVLAPVAIWWVGSNTAKRDQRSPLESPSAT